MHFQRGPVPGPKCRIGSDQIDWRGIDCVRGIIDESGPYLIAGGGPDH